MQGEALELATRCSAVTVLPRNLETKIRIRIFLRFDIACCMYVPIDRSTDSQNLPT